MYTHSVWDKVNGVLFIEVSSFQGVLIRATVEHRKQLSMGGCKEDCKCRVLIRETRRQEHTRLPADHCRPDYIHNQNPTYNLNTLHQV